MTTRNATTTRLVTLEEFAALPEFPRYELVKGVLVEKMYASREHEITVVRGYLASVDGHSCRRARLGRSLWQQPCVS